MLGQETLINLHLMTHLAVRNGHGLSNTASLLSFAFASFCPASWSGRRPADSLPPARARYFLYPLRMFIFLICSIVYTGWVVDDR